MPNGFYFNRSYKTGVPDFGFEFCGATLNQLSSKLDDMSANVNETIEC